MDGVASLSSVGAVTNQAQLRVAAQARTAKSRQSVAEDIGVAALKLIRAAAVIEPQIGNDLDVRV